MIFIIGLSTLYADHELNKFFDLCEDLTNAENTKIRWYSYTSISSSKDYIRAKSKYYNEPSFSDVLINMSEEESEYYTHLPKVSGQF